MVPWRFHRMRKQQCARYAVDENGVELPKVNGNYVDAPGYLKLCEQCQLHDCN